MDRGDKATITTLFISLAMVIYVFIAYPPPKRVVEPTPPKFIPETMYGADTEANIQMYITTEQHKWIIMINPYDSTIRDTIGKKYINGTH